jgi:hypothetical protein
LSAEHAYDQFQTHAHQQDVVAILTAHPHAKTVYETLLYPKAKDKTVDYVIMNYGKFFKRIPRDPMKKLMVPK